jgi:hypothetical protein
LFRLECKGKDADAAEDVFSSKPVSAFIETREREEERSRSIKVKAAIISSRDGADGGNV